MLKPLICLFKHAGSMKKFIIGICIHICTLAAVLAAAFFLFLQSEALSERIISALLPDDMDAQTTVKAQDVTLPGSFSLRGLTVQASLGGTPVKFAAGGFTLDNLHSFLNMANTGRILTNRLQNIDVILKDMQCTEARAVLTHTFEGFEWRQSEGEVSAQAVTFKKSSLRSLKADLSATRELLRFDNVSAELFEGDIDGTARVSLGKLPEFTVDLAGEDLNLATAAEQYPRLFSGFSGKSRVKIKLRGTPQTYIKECLITIELQEGGTIDPSFLSFLLDFLPASQQKQEYRRLIRTDTSLPLTTGDITIESSDEHTLTSRVNLTSTEYDLNVSVTFDVTVEGGLQGAITYMQEALDLQR